MDDDDLERALEKGAGAEEEQRLLHRDEEDVSNPELAARDLERRRKQRQKVFSVLYGALLAFTAAAFLAYSIRRPTTFTFLESSRLPSAIEDDNSLAIPLNPELHKYRAPRTIEHDWTITWDVRAPDGVEKQVYLVNDEFPGPTVEARSGDRLVFRVRNNLTDNEGLSIHWHGLFMRGANDMDGALGLTQSAIAQGDAMTYEFDVAEDQCGTFWYHAHSQLQRADGLYGGLVVHCPDEQDNPGKRPARQYESERLLLMGDWYHRPAAETLAWYHHWRSFGNEPVPDSLVINAGGSYNCSKAVPARPITCTPTSAQTLLSLTQAPTRLRVVNVGSMTGLTLRTPKASMFPFELDGGNPIEGSAAHSVGILYPGERVDLLIQPLLDPADDATTTSSMEIIMDPENFRYGNPALTPNQTFPISHASHSSSTPTNPLAPIHLPPIPPSLSPSPSPSSAPQTQAQAQAQAHFDLQLSSSPPSLFSPSPSQSHHPSSGPFPLSTAPNQTFLLYASTPLLSHLENRPTGFLNHSSYTHTYPPDPSDPPNRNTPPKPLISLPHSLWPPRAALLVPQLRAGAWVEVTINNVDEGGHAFHLHGHDVWVLRQWRSRVGQGGYDPWRGAVMNEPGMAGRYGEGEGEGNEGARWAKRPRKKDTVFVPRKGHAVVRFRVQEGEGAVGALWAMHCHVLWHQAVGMAMAWEVVE